jgi:superfamily I DNA/RNA helicase
MALVRADDWRPRGIDDLEPNAWRALRHVGSASVVAGPGAGKTEFLAQRAVYLLETGLCARPRRILAISFKRDAASNLLARVRERCPIDLSSRFVSQTFDAFTKGMVDRFLKAIPAYVRPRNDYTVDFLSRPAIQDFLDRTRTGAPAIWQHDIAGIQIANFESRCLGTYRLPAQPTGPQTAFEYVAERWWSEIAGAQNASLTFISLNRLAELVLRSREQIRRALRSTYPFVFVDEFQDTTYAQYDFLLSAFADPRVDVTAVGDDKQRIMTWAGARVDAFQKFEEDFGATRIQLLMNFRSSPELVRIQQVVAKELEPDVAPTIAHRAQEIQGDAAQVWKSTTKAAEAGYLGRWIASDLAERRKTVRDYALLVRQKSEEYEADISGSLADVGISIRNESRALGRTTLQDLLAEDICQVALSLLRLGASRHARNAFGIASDAVEAIRGADPQDEIACYLAARELDDIVASLRELMIANHPSSEKARELSDRVFTFLDLGAVRRTYLQYHAGASLAIAVEAFTLHLAACAAGAPGWTSCLDRFEGISSVPLMTIHKSKGLEFDTILFLGLDDSAWWSHTADNPEGVATFFVALSRAKQRAVFAFCQERGTRRLVADLYRLLTLAGVPEVQI